MIALHFEVFVLYSRKAQGTTAAGKNLNGGKADAKKTSAGNSEMYSGYLQPLRTYPD